MNPAAEALAAVLEIDRLGRLSDKSRERVTDALGEARSVHSVQVDADEAGQDDDPGSSHDETPQTPEGS